ncbi:ribonuclease PH [uncultured Cetobacterium sp.]|uniref:ribonuclease PH n=1 Tax=uncultured Cetobacterium sp. TaxID=527638 RepID=UPI00262D9C9F|nr:ribonuclease PH [uncultured Cetobacterium sp.]
MIRQDGRKTDEKREVKITRNYTIYAEGCVLIEVGHTRVICTATVVDKVPPFLRNQGKGWITAEYSMLPRATGERNQREAAKGKLGGRTMEIQRLIGRALRACIDLEKLGERTVTIDCDVIQADGGTRTTAITGGFIALEMAMRRLVEKGVLTENPITSNIAAISVGVVKGTPVLDLMYTEDSEAEVDMNVIMNDKGEFVEIQGTGEEATFTRKELNSLLDLAEKGVYELIEIQRKEIEEEFSK